MAKSAKALRTARAIVVRNRSKVYLKLGQTKVLLDSWVLVKSDFILNLWLPHKQLFVNTQSVDINISNVVCIDTLISYHILRGIMKTHLCLAIILI